jgi:hypothetical protein
MQIHVKNLNGEDYTLDGIKGTTTVSEVKQKLAKKVEVYASDISLIFSGKPLEDKYTLNDYNLTKESAVHMVIEEPTEEQIVQRENEICKQFSM